MNIIEATNITRTYGKRSSQFVAVDDVSLHVARGELVALLGTNGAGKTSLVEILEGFATPSAGTVSVFGKDPLRGRSHIRSRTGIMLQEAGFAGDLTVRETLKMWAGTLTASRSVDEALELTDLRARADVRVKVLSGGERRRLDLSMATMGRPELLFLDEPTTGLDPASRHRTWDLVRSMLDEGATVVLTTHYLEEAEELADRVLLMSHGRIQAAGTVAELVASQPATVTFAGDAHINASDPELGCLPALVGAPQNVRGQIVLSSSDLFATVAALVELASARGIRLNQLDARSASLEQTFLALNGQAATTPIVTVPVGN